jgi:hypothetical protein
VDFETDGEEDGSAINKKRQWILDNTSGDELVGMYKIAVESEDTAEERSISYAVSQGVRAEKFIERKLQLTDISGTPDMDTEYSFEDGDIETEWQKGTESGTKKREAVKSLLDSGYTDAEKVYFYQNEYSSDDDFAWALKCKIPVDAYLQLQRDKLDLKGKKDANGKTVSGSVKEDYINYVKGLDVSEMQRAIMVMQQGYALDEAYYAKVINYIRGLDLNTREKIAFADSLGLKTSGTTVYPKRK